MKQLFSLEGKVALVTGGSRGIGKMIARGLLEYGAKVYISSRKAAACEEACRELSAFGECVALPADLSRTEEIARFTAELAAREPKLHVLVNNAGVSWGAKIGEVPEKGWDKVMDTNLKGLFFLTQALLPQLEAAGTAADPARIINIGSIDGIQVSLFDAIGYGASKAGLHHMTRTMANRLAARHITANVIAPGGFETDMLAPMMSSMGDQIVGGVPLGRIGRAEDIAGVAVMLASRAGAYVTGAIIPVDGGVLIG
jgi:NAD(P)-dependent dehydrogenase (short-subunit alcohol dehydrogenase family)